MVLRPGFFEDSSSKNLPMNLEPRRTPLCGDVLHLNQRHDIHFQALEGVFRSGRQGIRNVYPGLVWSGTSLGARS